MAQNPETNQRLLAPTAPPAPFATSTPQQHQSMQLPQPASSVEHVYAVPAVVREDHQQLDESVLSRIRRETEMKEEFLKRPVQQQQQPMHVPQAVEQKELSGKKADDKTNVH